MTSVEPTPSSTVVYRRFEDATAGALMRGFDALTLRTFAVHQTALLRIGYGLVFLITLLREYPNRREIWGDQSPWSPAMARELLSNIDGRSVLLASDERWWFELVYVFAVVVGALFVLGWHTRAVSVLFAILVISFNSRSILMTDGGDTVLLLMSFYLAFTACGRVWSLDARRVARSRITTRTGPGHEIGVLVALVTAIALAIAGEWWWGAIAAAVVLCGLWQPPRPVEQVRRVLVNVMHNCALVVIGFEVCVIYGAAGMYKIQGEYWQDGTAMHYVMNLEYFSPWPGLSHSLPADSATGVFISYLTVFVQIGFVFLLFAKRAKYVAIVILLGMHFGIAILFGLPAFSASMSIGDALFLPTAFLLWTSRRAGGALARRRTRGEPPLARPDEPDAALASIPAQSRAPDGTAHAEV